MAPKSHTKSATSAQDPSSAAPSSPLSPPAGEAAATSQTNGTEPPETRVTEEDTTGTGEGVEQTENDPLIDPELADLPAPPHHLEPGTLSITESILQAPNPRPADFSMMPITGERSEVDVGDLDEVNLEGMPGSPTAKLLKAIAPPNAAQPDNKWGPPPPNASVNLFIGRALLSNGNDNWPLKPNDIVNWIRKHYPSEWDGDEGRCSAHRVRTYLARKGADMYYEKLNQGTIAGWRIRQNHLWRFENGGFLGRGMKQEEAIAAQAKENEAIATAAHKASAAAALAAGHPGVKVSMSAPGISDGPPPMKKARPIKVAGQARRRNAPIKGMKSDPSMDAVNDLSLAQAQAQAEHQAFYDSDVNTVAHSHDAYNPATSYDSAGPSTLIGATDEIDPNLMGNDDNAVDMDMVQRAMQAAAANAGQMEDLDMGMQLPIEMQMHGGEHDDRADWGTGSHPYTPHGGEFGYTSADGQVYGTGYGGQ